jgi:hypothetical protein
MNIWDLSTERTSGITVNSSLDSLHDEFISIMLSLLNFIGERRDYAIMLVCLSIFITFVRTDRIS